MPLPDFANLKKAWVEKTKASHGHGGEGWEFGTCLWSPAANKSGVRIYENMRAASDGDLVLHFYEDTPFGRTRDHYFCGLSIVDGNCTTTNEEPPRAAEWAGRPQYYRVNLRDFTSFVDAIPVRELAERFNSEIILSLGAETDSPFIDYGGRVRLAQGKYLAQCGPALYRILSGVVDEPVVLPAQPINRPPRNAPESPQPFDYEEYVEGQRAKREALFFSRNSKLVRDAKEHYQFRCQACSFRFDEMYSEIGAGFIEIHHLNPLSERAKAEIDGRLTRLSQVTALCANCHRIIHRLIRQAGRSISIEELQAHIQQARA